MLEEGEIKAKVDWVFTLEIEGDIYLDRGDVAGSASCASEANAIQDELERHGVTLEEHEESAECWYVLVDDHRRWQFDTGNWLWSVVASS